MPDITKPVQDGEPAEASEGECADPECPRCGEHHAPVEDDLVPGSRRWFWYKRFENSMLFIAPAVPLFTGLAAFIQPQVTTPLTDRQAAAVNGAYEYATGKPSTVDQVRVVLDDPGIWDRLVSAGPALVFGALLAFMAYALWRIEINLSGNARPFTEKDDHVLWRASRWLWGGWWFLLVLEIAVGSWFHQGPSGGWYRAGAHTPFDSGSFIVLVLSGFMGVVSRIYRTGARQYRELESGV